MKSLWAPIHHNFIIGSATFPLILAQGAQISGNGRVGGAITFPVQASPVGAGNRTICKTSFREATDGSAVICLQCCEKVVKGIYGVSRQLIKGGGTPTDTRKQPHRVLIHKSSL